MKEELILNQLLEENADVELIFLKYLLDTRVTEEKMGDYSKEYTELTEDQKWEFAIFYKQELNRNMFFWEDFLLTVEVPLAQFRKEKLQNEV